MNSPEGQIAIVNMDMAVIKHYFSCETFNKIIMPGFSRTKIVGTALMISGVEHVSCSRNTRLTPAGATGS